MGNNLAKCTRMCKGCGAATLSGLGLSLFCVAGCSLVLSVRVLFRAVGVVFRGRDARNFDRREKGRVRSKLSDNVIRGNGWG